MAQLAENSNVNLWQFETKEGKSIKKCLDWMIPYINKEKDWSYEQIKNIGYGDTIYLLKIAAKKYSESAYDILAQETDIKSYLSDLNQLTF